MNNPRAGFVATILVQESAMSIFPLPLAPFEHMILADDSPDHPMSFFIQLKFQGCFDRPHLNAALQKALTLHPLLNCLIQGSAKDTTARIFWIESAAPPPEIDWNDADVPCRFATGRWMDLRSETGIRLWLREATETTTLLLQVHHACCDGVGVSSFINTVLLAYHLLQTSRSLSELDEAFDPRLLRERDLSTSSWLRIMKTVWQAIFRLGRYFKTQPVPLATPRALPADISFGDQFPRFQTHTFSEADTEQIRVAAKRLGVNLNVLLLRDLYLILDEWNQRHSIDNRSQAIRVCVPINLRRSIDNNMPAANVVSLSFLERNTQLLSDPIRLLRSLHEQLEKTVRVRDFLSFIPALKLLGKSPGRLLAHMQRPRCQASAGLSNLGIVLARSPLLGRDRRAVAGGVILESMEPFMPLRRLTHAAFAVSNYGRKLYLTISHDPRWIDETDSRELLNNFARQLLATSEQPQSPTTH